MPPGKTQSVLVIDDDAAVRDEIQSLLQLRNVDCKTAGDITEARSVLLSDPHRRVVIVDFHLVGMTGAEIIELLRGEISRELGFIMLTGDDSQACAIEAVRAGAADFLCKPPDGRELVRTIDRVWRKLGGVEKEPRREAVVSAKRFEVVSSRDLAESLRDLSSQIRERERHLERLLYDDHTPPAADGQGWKLALNVLLRHLREVRSKVDHELDPADPLSVEAVAAAAERLIDVLGSTVIPNQSPPSGVGLQNFELETLIARLSPSIEQSVIQKQARIQVQLPEEPTYIPDKDGRLGRTLSEIALAVVNALEPDDQLVFTTSRSVAEVSLHLKLRCGPSSATAIRSIFDCSFGVQPTRHADEIQEFKNAACQLAIGLHGGYTSIEDAGTGRLRAKINLPFAKPLHTISQPGALMS